MNSVYYLSYLFQQIQFGDLSFVLNSSCWSKQSWLPANYRNDRIAYTTLRLYKGYSAGTEGNIEGASKAKQETDTKLSSVQGKIWHGIKGPLFVAQ